MKKPNNNPTSQTKIDFPVVDKNKIENSAKVVNINAQSKRSYDAFVIRNTRSF